MRVELSGKAKLSKYINNDLINEIYDFINTINEDSSVISKVRFVGVSCDCNIYLCFEISDNISSIDKDSLYITLSKYMKNYQHISDTYISTSSQIIVDDGIVIWEKKDEIRR